jgi:hypothetical protein
MHALNLFLLEHIAQGATSLFDSLCITEREVMQRAGSSNLGSSVNVGAKWQLVLCSDIPGIQGQIKTQKSKNCMNCMGIAWCCELMSIARMCAHTLGVIYPLNININIQACGVSINAA